MEPDAGAGGQAGGTGARPDGAEGRPRSAFLDALEGDAPLHALEFRPPPTGLGGRASVDAWIDLHQGVRRLLREDRFVLFTDDAVGDREEESLQHLTSNLGDRADLSHVVPFLTCKHTLEYCLLFARRVASHGLGGVTVTGGDPEIGVPRCLPRSRDLRVRIRSHLPGLPLGAWVNPRRDPERQVDWLLEGAAEADYYVTQVVSHHDLAPLDRFLEAAARRGVPQPGLVGVFFYRSARPRTLERLANFIPVPAVGLAEEFEAGVPAEEVCARTLRALAERGVRKVYLSNVEPRRATDRLRGIEALL